MSHTNHRRGDVKKRYWLGQQRGPRYDIFSNGYQSMDGTGVGAGSTAACSSRALTKCALNGTAIRSSVSSRPSKSWSNT